jgi:hypothetical protein
MSAGGSRGELSNSSKVSAMKKKRIQKDMKTKMK